MEGKPRSYSVVWQAGSLEALDASYRYIGARAAEKLLALANRGAGGNTAKSGSGPFPVLY